MFGGRSRIVDSDEEQVQPMLHLNSERTSESSEKSDLSQNPFYNLRQNEVDLTQTKPTLQQTELVLQIIRTTMPNRSIQSAVNLLYNVIVNEHKIETLFPQEFAKDVNFKPNQSNEYVFVKASLQNISQMNAILRSVAKSFILHSYNFIKAAQQLQKFQKKYQNKLKLNQIQLIQKQMIGRQIEMEYKPIVMLQQDYPKFLEQMVKITFRNLQKYLKTNFDKNIQRIAEQKLIGLKQKLIFIADFVTKQSVNVFFKFVKISFSLSDVRLYEQQTMRLYFEIMRLIVGPLLQMSDLWSQESSMQEQAIFLQSQIDCEKEIQNNCKQQDNQIERFQNEIELQQENEL